jgi:aminoglycoside 3-N-acetyltransferase
MNEYQTAERITSDLRALGVRPGDIIMVHSSLKSLGHVPGGPETVIRGLFEAVTPAGTLLLPALSWKQQPPLVHSTLHTPSNVGAIPEYFRTRPGTRRSVHPTHSVCAIGQATDELLRDHHLDSTPCGPHSPFRAMIDRRAKIVMLGCGLRPNTTMHALEEYVEPPYLFGPPRVYTITDADGHTYTRTYRPHGFGEYRQRYDRVADLPDTSFLRAGRVLDAETFLLDAMGLRSAVLTKLREETFFFVERAPAESP